ncbi:MAG: 50S ribosomal protein L11 methyltransferase [Anaerolineales bacterium]|nr:50S ribosomal protein L11 methyltransferase [Anaerolineales bacterium]
MSTTPTAWLRISLEVDPELAEAVSEVLARYLPGGVAIESTAVTADAEDEGHPIGPLRVLGYIPHDAQTEEVRSQIEQGLRYLAMIQPLPDPNYETIHEQNWMESWKQHYHPLSIGERLVVLPAWVQMDTAGRVEVRIEPGMAFGTGVHPTTQLSLELLEAHLQPGDALIDIGCGSAILAIAGAKLGAAPVLAVDNDASTMDNARHNIALNQAGVELGVGSVAEVLAGHFGQQQAEVVVANILAPVLVRLLDAGLHKLLKPGGVLVLSGILAEQEPELRAALAAAGLQITAERRSGDWLGLAAKMI